MASSKPFHVLLLAGGKRSRPEGDDARDGRGVGVDGGFDDYLRRRGDFRRKAASRRGRGTSGTAVVRGGDGSSGADGDGDGGKGAKGGGPTSLRNLASPLEIALSACCERGDAPRGDGGVDDDVPAPKNGATTSAAGVLRSGREGHFLKLLLMYCPKHAVGHRALALAILQRTVDWEISNNDAGHCSKVKMESTSKLGAGENAGDERRARTRWTSLNDIHAERIASFLTAGGMKLLSRWLIDSVTGVPTLSTNPKRKDIAAQNTPSLTGCLLLSLLHLLKCMPFDKDIVVESQIHKSIKRLKKALDKLVEGLDPNTLEKEVHPIAGGLSVGKVVEAVDDIMASWGEAAAVKSPPCYDTPPKANPHQRLQAEILLRFNDLAKFQSMGGEPPAWLPKSILGMWRASNSHAGKPKNPVHILKANSMPAATAGNPSTSHLGKPRNPIKPLPAGSAQAAHPRDPNCAIGTHVKLLQPLVKMGQDKRTGEGPFSGKRKGSAIMSVDTPRSGKMPKQEKANASSKSVSWALPLKEERHFIKEEMVATETASSEEAEEEPISYDEHDSDLEDLF